MVLLAKEQVEVKLTPQEIVEKTTIADVYRAVKNLDGVIYKIGTTIRLPKTRLLEIAGELFDVLGHIPKIELIRQRQTKDNYKIEAQILRETENHRCTLGMGEWSGESELRQMNQEQLLAIYDRAIAEDYAPTKKFEVEL